MVLKVRRTNIPWLERIFSVLIILLPFLYQYRGIGNVISLGEMLLFPVALLLFVKCIRRNFRYLDAWLLLFYLITMITTFMCIPMQHFSISSSATVLIRMWFYGLVILLGRQYFCLEYAKKLYYILTGIFSVYLIIQWIYHLKTGGYLPIYVSYDFLFAPEKRAMSLEKYYQYAYRSSSLFLEPSYFSLFVLPAVCFLVYEKRKNWRCIILLLITIIALLLSTASSGVIGMIVIFGSYLFGRVDNKNGYARFKRTLVIVGAVGLILIYLFFADSAGFLLSRIKSGGSINYRITRGFLTYKTMPFINKLIGVGVNNLDQYMIFYRIRTPYDESNLNYCASLIQTLNYTGIVGFLSLIGFLLHLWRKCKLMEVKNASPIFVQGATSAIFILLLFIMSYESVLFSYRFAFYLILVESINRNNRVEKLKSR